MLGPLARRPWLTLDPSETVAAFPELDAFDDGGRLPRAFVRSRDGVVARQTGAVGDRGGVGVLGFRGRRSRCRGCFDGFPVYGYDVLRYTPCWPRDPVLLLVAFGGALLMHGDYLLRWQVQRVIRGRRVRSADTRVLGMPVGENLQVVCRSAGLRRRWTPAGELVPNEKGAGDVQRGGSAAGRVVDAGPPAARKVKRVVGFGTLGIVGTAAVLWTRVCSWLFCCGRRGVARRDRNWRRETARTHREQPADPAIVEKPLGPNATAAEIERGTAGRIS